MKRFMKVMMMFLLVLLCTALLAGSALANDAKDYIPAPAGTAVLVYYFDHSSGNETYQDGARITSATNLTTDVGVFRGIYWGQLAGHTTSLNLILPVGNLQLDGAAIGNAQSSTGLGDPIVVGSIHLYENPKTKTYFAVAGYLTLPLGEYRNDQILNMGSHRWAVKPEMGLEQGFGNSGFNLGIYANIQFYTNNNDYTPAGFTLKQEPTYGAEAHLTYDFTKSVYVGVDYYYKGGGKTSVDNDSGGYVNDDELNTHSVGVRFAWDITPQTIALIKYTEDVSVQNGIKMGDIGFRIVYAW